MSDSIFKFIPVDPYAKLQAQQIRWITDWQIAGVISELEVSDQLQFADAGENFESVLCPFCRSDLREWWGDAMSGAYSLADGFGDLGVVTPCCKRETSLDALEYRHTQGFYKTQLSLMSTDVSSPDCEAVLRQLRGVSGIDWRVVIARI